MKISDLLGEGWESDERSDAPTEPRATGSAPTEPVEPRSSDVIASLASWAPAPEPHDPQARGSESPAEPGSARAQLADLAAGLAVPSAPPVEAEVIEAPDELAGLDFVVDDLLPAATKRSKGSARGSSRSGSRRRGR